MLIVPQHIFILLSVFFNLRTLWKPRRPIPTLSFIFIQSKYVYFSPKQKPVRVRFFTCTLATGIDPQESHSTVTLTVSLELHRRMYMSWCVQIQMNGNELKAHSLSVKSEYETLLRHSEDKVQDDMGESPLFLWNKLCSSFEDAKSTMWNDTSTNSEQGSLANKMAYVALMWLLWIYYLMSDFIYSFMCYLLLWIALIWLKCHECWCVGSILAICDTELHFCEHEHKPNISTILL